MAWSQRCAVRGCRAIGDRLIHWVKAGDSLLCEDHYQEYRKRFRHLVGSAEVVKPDPRFSDSGQKIPETVTETQLEL